MHIPSTQTQQLAVLPFAEALAKSGKSQACNAAEWLYVPDFYTEYRYILGTRGNKPLICIGINPSTAEPGNLDPTLKSVERIAKNNGFDSFIMFNVYAQRATRPEDMDRTLNPALHRENMDAFRYILSASPHPSVWAAWGNLIEQRAYLKTCVREMLEIGKAYNANWFTAGPRSKKGHPHHPLYLKSATPLDPFHNLEDYLSK